MSAKDKLIADVVARGVACLRPPLPALLPFSPAPVPLHTASPFCFFFAIVESRLFS